MNENFSPKFNNLFLPFKSIAVALLFCVFLGPVGVLYSSLSGGIIMIVLCLLVLRAKLAGPVIIVWLLSCIWGVAAANRYNKKILRSVAVNTIT